MSLKIDLAIKKAKEKVNRSIEDSIDKKDMEELASFAANMITKRTRLGYGVQANYANKEKLKELDIDYIHHREQMNDRYSKKTGKLLKKRAIEGASDKFSSFLKTKNSDKLNTSLTSVKKSNLTMTGQLLDSIKWTVEKTKAILFIPNTNRRNSDLTNREVGGYVSKKRPFFFFSRSEINQLKRKALTILKGKFKRT